MNSECDIFVQANLSSSSGPWYLFVRRPFKFNQGFIFGVHSTDSQTICDLLKWVSFKVLPKEAYSGIRLNIPKTSVESKPRFK